MTYYQTKSGRNWTCGPAIPVGIYCTLGITNCRRILRIFSKWKYWFMLTGWHSNGIVPIEANKCCLPHHSSKPLVSCLSHWFFVIVPKTTIHSHCPQSQIHRQLKNWKKRKTVYFIKNYVLHNLMQTVAEQQIQGHLCSPCNFYITSSAKNAIDI